MQRSLRHALAAVALPVLLSGGTALAQTSGALGGFKVDSSLPIEISADALEVRQEQQTAVFTGSVDARQGEVRMQADQLVVSYDQNADGGDDAAAGAIRRVRAEGSVFVSSAEGAAEGNWADYDVASGSITMGDSVTLVQGEQNVLKGNALRIDLNTGFARLDAGGVNVDGTRDRVQGVFFPPQKN